MEPLPNSIDYALISNYSVTLKKDYSLFLNFLKVKLSPFCFHELTKLLHLYSNLVISSEEMLAMCKVIFEDYPPEVYEDFKEVIKIREMKSS